MSYAILLLACAEICLLAWAIRRLIAEPTNVALLAMLFIIFPVCIDSLTVAGGRWIGFGTTLEALNRIRYSWFIFSMPLLWPICAAILANAKFKVAQHRALIPTLTVLALAIGGYEAVQAWQQEFHAACVFDIKRYVLQVPVGQECMGSQAGDGTFGLPLIVPLATLCVAATGIVLWWKRQWPWVALICTAMIAVVAVPQSNYSTFLSYPVDGLLTATLAITAVRFYGERPSS